MLLLLLLIICIVIIISLILIKKTLFNIFLVLGISILVSISIVLIFKILSVDKYTKKFSLGNNTNSRLKLNIYGKPLDKCSVNEDSGASQMPDKTCSELDNGVHQICIKNIGLDNSFSGNTGQTNWSESRGSNNHCACIGAWANYSAKMGKNNDKTLKCSAIPETSLDSKYSVKWKNWNNVTIKNQDKDGLNQLRQQCMVQAPDKTSRKYLTKLLSKIM